MVSKGQIALVLGEVDLSIAPGIRVWKYEGEDQTSLVLGFRGTSCSPIFTPLAPTLAPTFVMVNKKHGVVRLCLLGMEYANTTPFFSMIWIDWNCFKIKAIN
jgi:hypothetical protein